MKKRNSPTPDQEVQLQNQKFGAYIKQFSWSMISCRQDRKSYLHAVICSSRKQAVEMQGISLNVYFSIKPHHHWRHELFFVRCLFLSKWKKTPCLKYINLYFVFDELVALFARLWLKFNITGYEISHKVEIEGQGKVLITTNNLLCCCNVMLSTCTYRNLCCHCN